MKKEHEWEHWEYLKTYIYDMNTDIWRYRSRGRKYYLILCYYFDEKKNIHFEKILLECKKVHSFKTPDELYCFMKKRNIPFPQFLFPSVEVRKNER